MSSEEIVNLSGFQDPDHNGTFKITDRAPDGTMKVAPVLRSQVSDEEIARRVEVVQRETASPEPTLADFKQKVDRLWNRQAIAALTVCAGQCMGVRIPPKPLLLQQAEEVFEQETGVKQG